MQTKAPQPTIGTARYCAVTLKPQDPDGFWNTGHVLTGHDPNVWISATGARELAKLEGWHSPEEWDSLRRQVHEIQSQLTAAVEEISELRKNQEQIDGLAAVGFKVVKTGGAPTAKTKPENIRKELAAS